MNVSGELVGFAVIMAIGQFSPGPDMLLITRTSLAEGLKAGWAVVAGIVSGLAVHATLAIGGIAVILARGGLLSNIVTWLAATYLLWLSLGLLKKQPQKNKQSLATSSRGPYLRGLFCNLLNPKVFVFFSGVVAPFLAQDPELWFLGALWVVIVLEGLFLWGVWVWLLQLPYIRSGYQGVARGLDIVFALCLMALSMSLVLL